MYQCAGSWSKMRSHIEWIDGWSELTDCVDWLMDGVGELIWYGTSRCERREWVHQWQNLEVLVADHKWFRRMTKWGKTVILAITGIYGFIDSVVAITILRIHRIDFRRDFWDKKGMYPRAQVRRNLWDQYQGDKKNEKHMDKKELD